MMRRATVSRAAGTLLLALGLAGCGGPPREATSPTAPAAPAVRLASRNWSPTERTIIRAAERRGVNPVVLLALARQESSLNPRAKSPTGAYGLFQFQPAAARQYGLRVDRRRDERADPAKSAEAAARYLLALRRRYAAARDTLEGWRLAVAAYNTGEGTLDGVVRRARAAGAFDGTWAGLLAAPFWSSPAKFREVRTHVQKVLGERGPLGGYGAEYGR